MRNFSAVLVSIMLHIVFVTGFVATGAAAVQLATDRAYQASLTA